MSRRDTDRQPNDGGCTPPMAKRRSEERPRLNADDGLGQDPAVNRVLGGIRESARTACDPDDERRLILTERLRVTD